MNTNFFSPAALSDAVNADQIVRRDARAAVEKELTESDGLDAEDFGISDGDVYKFTITLETDDGDLRAHLIVPVNVEDGVVSFDKSVPFLSTEKKLTGIYGDVEFLISEHYDASENNWTFDD